MMFELPPQVSGSEDAVKLRDYLVRLAQSLEPVTESKAMVVTQKAVGKAQDKTVKDIQAQAAELKALIIKTADKIYSYADSKVEEYNGLYVAQSDFGSYYEVIKSDVETTARGTVESYHYADLITTAQSTAEDAASAAEAYRNELNGQIRRGIMEDPSTHELHLGIAISENLEFTGQTQPSGGHTYYRLKSGQTLGLYTSTGWQFWINGVKRGWFSSEDSMLHVSNIVVEERLQIGSDWEITTTNGFGLRYIGG